MYCQTYSVQNIMHYFKLSTALGMLTSDPHPYFLKGIKTSATMCIDTYLYICVHIYSGSITKMLFFFFKHVWLGRIRSHLSPFPKVN